MSRGTGREMAIVLLVCSVFATCDRIPAPQGGPQVIVEHVTRLGYRDVVEFDEEVPGMISGLVSLTKLRDGRYALYDKHLPGVVRFFSSDGVYLSTMGRQGYGPGEFQEPTFHFIEATGDTLFIIDVALNRISAFSADGKRLYDTRLAIMGRADWGTFLEDGSFIANSVRLTAEGVGLPLHLMNTAGEVLSSFGTDFPVNILGGHPVHFRHTDVDEDGRLWVAPGLEYRVERWRHTSNPDEPFVLDTTFVPGTVEFPPVSERRVFPRTVRDGPPSPSVQGVWRQPGGPVWVILWLVRDDWADRYEYPSIIDPGFYATSPSYRMTRLEALDPVTGRVLASYDLDPLWMQFIGGGEAFSYGMTEVGIPYLDIWTVRLR